jgi:hypothetical protein
VLSTEAFFKQNPAATLSYRKLDTGYCSLFITEEGLNNFEILLPVRRAANFIGKKYNQSFPDSEEIPLHIWWDVLEHPEYMLAMFEMGPSIALALMEYSVTAIDSVPLPRTPTSSGWCDSRERDLLDSMRDCAIIRHQNNVYTFNNFPKTTAEARYLMLRYVRTGSPIYKDGQHLRPGNPLQAIYCDAFRAVFRVIADAQRIATGMTRRWVEEDFAVLRGVDMMAYHARVLQEAAVPEVVPERNTDPAKRPWL